GVMARLLLPSTVLATPEEQTPASTSPRHAAAEIDPTPTEVPRPTVRGETVERTRGGLVKRTKRTTPAAPQPESVDEPAPDMVPDRAPQEVGSMLSAVRSAHQRGRDEHGVAMKS